MKYWKISETESKNKYLILTEKSIWFTSQPEGVNIEELIETKTLESIRSIRYEDLKEIICIDSDFIIQLNFKDDKTLDEDYKMDESIYGEIKLYLKNHLKGIQVKNYSIFKQVLSQCITLGISIILIAVTYVFALELETGEDIVVSGRRGWLKRIIIGIADILGTMGTLIIGGLIIVILVYFIIKKLKNPKTGEILKLTKSPQLIA